MEQEYKSEDITCDKQDSGSKKMKTFSIDVDGVIGVSIAVDEWDYSKIKEHKVYPKTIEKINKLFDEGHIIILHTGRKEIRREFTKKWLKMNNVKYHKLKMGKPQCDIYVDDRAIVGREQTIKSFLEFSSENTRGAK